MLLKHEFELFRNLLSLQDAIILHALILHRTDKVLVESNSIEFLQELDNQSSVGQCVISLGDVDEGLANAAAVKARGISLEYGVELVDAEVVSLIHRKGYGLILWVVNEPDDISAAWNSEPDFIETDNLQFRDYISR